MLSEEESQYNEYLPTTLITMPTENKLGVPTRVCVPMHIHIQARTSTPANPITIVSVLDSIPWVSLPAALVEAHATRGSLDSLDRL